MRLLGMDRGPRRPSFPNKKENQTASQIPHDGVRVAASLAFFTFSAARAQTPPSRTTLYAFHGEDERPTAGVVGTGRALYGTTLATVFTLEPPASAGGGWTETGLQNVEQPTGI